jgi:hypothetical protein
VAGSSYVVLTLRPRADALGSRSPDHVAPCKGRENALMRGAVWDPGPLAPLQGGVIS